MRVLVEDHIIASVALGSGKADILRTCEGERVGEERVVAGRRGRDIETGLGISVGERDRASAIRRGGIGLDNLSKRLELIYGEQASMTVTQEEDSYTTKLEIPLRR